MLVYEYIRPLSLIKIEIFIIYKLRVGGWSGGIYQLRSAIAKIMCKKNKGSMNCNMFKLHLQLLFNKLKYVKFVHLFNI